MDSSEKKPAAPADSGRGLPARKRRRTTVLGVLLEKLRGKKRTEADIYPLF